jgi:hypothetical protein
MTHDEQMPGQADARLDARLRGLPLEVEPERDLWAGIAARIETGAAPMTVPARRPAWMWQAAAAVVLVAGSSLLTASLLDRQATVSQSAQQPGAVPVAPAAGQAAPATAGESTVLPAAFGPAGRLDNEYLAARQQLTRVLDGRIAALPPSARAKLEFNLGEMRRAADEINAALAAQPGDPLLEELLLKTYQDELAVLSNVNELTNSLERAQAPSGETRMQL